jgi:hypothetical protein
MPRLRRRLFFVSLLLVALAGVTVGVLWWTAPNHRLGWSGYHRIQLGMTEQEVEQILEVPPGSHLNVPEGELRVYDHAAAASKGTADAAKGYSWVSNEGNLGICVNDAGVVVGVSFTPLRPENPSFFDKVRRWLRL